MGFEYPEYANASMQKLRDNASRFKREPAMMLVRKRNGVDLQQGNEQQEEREHEMIQEHETELEATMEDLTDEITKKQEPGTEIREAAVGRYES